MLKDKRKDLFSLLLIELEKAENKHPEFPPDPSGAANIITEEMLEFVRAVNDGENMSCQIEEAAHVAVTAMRFIERNMPE